MRIDTFLAQVSAEVAKNGYISAKEARGLDGTDSTGIQAFWAVEEKSTFFAAEDEARAAEALEYIREMEVTVETPKFLRDLQDACRGETIGSDQVNLVANLIDTYQNMLSEAEFAEDGSASEHIGTVHVELHKRCTVIQKRKIPTRFGVSNLIKFRDEDGNILAWWASKMPVFDVGAEVRLIGKVKKHDSYNGVLETYVTRCKLSLAPSKA